MTVPTPTDLYQRDDLFGGWADDDPSSYATTFDGTTYLTAVRQGLRSPRSGEIAHERAEHDTAVTRILHERLTMAGRRAVAIMGGHALDRAAPEYAATALIAGRLSAVGMTVLTGGGPGAMEAAHLGARLGRDLDRLEDALAIVRGDEGAHRFPLDPGELVHRGEFVDGALARLHRWQTPAFRLAGETDSLANETIGIPTWLYGHEPPTPLATGHAKYFENSIREDGLLALATQGIVFMPGRAGTIQEIFQDAAQNLYRTVRGISSPMVFYDVDGYWSERFPVKAVLDALFAGEPQALLHYSTDVDQIVETLDRFDSTVS